MLQFRGSWVHIQAPTLVWDARHHSCSGDWFIQFSLTNIHKGDIKNENIKEQKVTYGQHILLDVSLTLYFK